MTRVNNYLLQVAQAKKVFLRYDQQALVRKLNLQQDEGYLYATMLSSPYRIDRRNGDLERLEAGAWLDANTHGEYMTLLDLICDSLPDRFLSCRWKNTAAFGRAFHQNLLESRDPFAEEIQARPEAFRKACEAMGGISLNMGDMGYAIELFDGLRIALQFWEGDEEFPPKVNFLWDENALMYLKYETMWYAVGLLKQRLEDKMKTLTA